MPHSIKKNKTLQTLKIMFTLLELAVMNITLSLKKCLGMF